MTPTPAWLRGYPATLTALAVGGSIWLSAFFERFDVLDRWLGWTARFERFEVDVLAVVVALVALGLVIDLRRRERRKQVDRLKRDFVSVVSHELRTPLTSMHGALGLLAGRLADELPPRSREMVEVAHRNSERLVRLVNDIVDVQRIGGGAARLALEPVDVDAVLEDTLDRHRAAASDAGVTVELRAGTGGAAVLADRERLAQVVAHLLSNGIKFSPAGGRVDVVAHRADDRVRVAVRDTGAGVPTSFRSRIFDAFSLADASSRRPTEGSGLGLTLARALVEQMGGRLDYRSEVGSGSTFYFDLPLAVPRTSSTGTGDTPRRSLG